MSVPSQLPEPFDPRHRSGPLDPAPAASAVASSLTPINGLSFLGWAAHARRGTYEDPTADTTEGGW